MAMSKGPAYSGPTLHGWGRTKQKRRMEMEAGEGKYGKREFSLNEDKTGYTARTTDYLEMRTFYNMGSRWGTWIFHSARVGAIIVLPGYTFIGGPCKFAFAYDIKLQRDAWW